VQAGFGVVGAIAARGFACFTLSLAVGLAHAFTIEHAQALYVDEQYQFELVAMIAAPVERVEAVLRDYPHYSNLDARILDSKVLERPEQDVAILATTVRACMGPFCRNVKRVERVQEAPLELTATTDASRSDVKSGETRTQLTAAANGTRVTYRTRIVPDYWIPAIVGRRLMLRTLEEATINMFTNVEKIASEQRPSAAEPPRTLYESEAGPAATTASPSSLR
jgi:Polyketide cyclase / dehydrase and lipid transport